MKLKYSAAHVLGRHKHVPTQFQNGPAHGTCGARSVAARPPPPSTGPQNGPAGTQLLAHKKGRVPKSGFQLAVWKSGTLPDLEGDSPFPFKLGKSRPRLDIRSLELHGDAPRQTPASHDPPLPLPRPRSSRPPRAPPATSRRDRPRGVSSRPSRSADTSATRTRARDVTVPVQRARDVAEPMPASGDTAAAVAMSPGAFVAGQDSGDHLAATPDAAVPVGCRRAPRAGPGDDAGPALDPAPDCFTRTTCQKVRT